MLHYCYHFNTLPKEGCVEPPEELADIIILEVTFVSKIS